MKKKSIILELDDDAWKVLEDLAKKEERSVTRQVIWMIKQAISNEISKKIPEIQKSPESRGILKEALKSNERVEIS